MYYLSVNQINNIRDYLTVIQADYLVVYSGDNQF